MSSSYSTRCLAASMSISTFVFAVGTAYALDVDQTQKLEVTAVVGDACTVTAATLAFGEIDPTQESTQQGTVEVNCLTDTSLGIKLGKGQNNTAGNAREMIHSDGTELPYLLYTDSFGGTAWTDTEVRNVIVDTEVPGSGDVPVFGTIPGVFNLSDGLYTDDVLITLVFVD